MHRTDQKNHSAAACSSSSAIKVENTRWSNTLCLILPMCLQQQVLPIWLPLFTLPGRDAASPLRPYDFKDPAAARTTDGQARRLPDVNKHSSILPSKRLSHCCGQRCLTCVMSDDVAGSALVVLMYSGAFHDLLKSCGEGGVCSTTMLNLHRSKSSVKTDNWVIWYQRSFLFRNNGEGAT